MSNIKLGTLNNGCTYCLSHKVHIRGDGRRAYYRIRIKGKRYYLHRYLWEQKFGEIPKGKILMHTCDNVLCVNIDHLIPGTHKENMADMKSKGRTRNGYSKK